MYILLLSIHGLIRGHGLELGRDQDTGGQTKYIVDLTQALAGRDDVDRVDLVTRRVVDPAVAADYGRTTETLSRKARIMRIDAGPEEYLAKEQLWDYLDSFCDNLVTTLNKEGRVPDLVHSHYADAGYVGVRLSSLLGIRIMTVDDIRRQLPFADVTQGIVCEGIEAIPQLLLVDVALLTTVEAHNTDFIAELACLDQVR